MGLLKFINEDLAATKSNFQLKKSSLNDPHIQDTIKVYAKTKGIDLQDAKDQFKIALDKQIKGLGSSKMNKNAVDNAAESVAFQFIQELDPDEIDLSAYGVEDREDLLDRDYFFDLTQYVLGENAQFFPLRNPFEKKAVRPFFFITPDHLPLMKDQRLKQSAQNHCQTAFCTPAAEMVFNRKFTEQLAISALINKVKPKSKKYKANGGDIPDHYCYLEFVIMHELLHFSAGDHFYTKPMVKRIAKKYPKAAGRAHLILNYVGDFINNWQLAKSGYEQLPIGLFSEEINYDKFGSYEEIIDAVIEEVMDMSDKDFNDMKDEMEKGMDEHMDNPDDTPSPGGADSDPGEKMDGPEPQSMPDQPGQPSSPDSADDGDQGDGQSGQNGQPSNQPPKIYKQGDIVTLNKTGEKCVVTYASEPDENGKQTVKVEKFSDLPPEARAALGETFKSWITDTVLNEEMTLSSEDISMWQGGDSGDQDGQPSPQPGEPGEPGDDEDGEDGQGSGSGGEPGDEEGEDGEDGQGSGSGGEPSNGDSGEEGDGESGEDGQPSNQPGEPGQSSGPRGDNPFDPNNQQPGGSGEQSNADDISKAIDDAMKNNQNKVDQRDDGNNDAQSALENKDTDDQDADIKSKVGQGSSKIEFKETEVVINWKKILKKMIPTGEGEAEDTYAKMSRQATSSMVTARQTGAGRISPGEVIIDSTKKGLVFVIDTSGSVMSVVNEFNQEIMNLLKKNKKFLENMYIVKFSDGFELSKIDINKMKAQQIKNPHDMVDNKKSKIHYGTEQTVQQLFSIGWGAGTYYTNEMHKVIEFLHSQNMNIIMFTDDDLVYDNNVKKFYQLARKRKNSTAMFITDKSSYRNMVNKYGNFKWVTYLK